MSFCKFISNFEPDGVSSSDLFFFFQVTRADYLTGRTALHFAAVNGHVRCLRLVVADFVPSLPFDSINAQTEGDLGDGSNLRNKHGQRFVSHFCIASPCPFSVILKCMLVR